ncbi:hypothetical protein JTE90_008768 [Oedothorax gibbosus]|uniref:Uncharacterized protein n=1 Tax=Oedothorax gibbosus TaxID=931172 RepID=A0AAV6TE58_9ARAC|nr:hypothetical protein JTE90_008768 [Oedothorax gibbosus]
MGEKNPTFGEFCFENDRKTPSKVKKQRRYKRLAATTRYPGNSSDTSCIKSKSKKDRWAPAFAARFHTENKDQRVFCPFAYAGFSARGSPWDICFPFDRCPPQPKQPP